MGREDTACNGGSEPYLEHSWVCQDGSEQVHVVMQRQRINYIVLLPCRQQTVVCAGQRPGKRAAAAQKPT